MGECALLTVYVGSLAAISQPAARACSNVGCAGRRTWADKGCQSSRGLLSYHIQPDFCFHVTISSIVSPLASREARHRQWAADVALERYFERLPEANISVGGDLYVCIGGGGDLWWD